MVNIQRNKKIVLVSVIIALSITLTVLPAGSTTHSGLAAASPLYPSNSTTTTMPWFFNGAYLNFSVVELVRGGRYVGFVTETVVSAYQNNGSFEVKTTENVGGYLGTYYANYTPSTSIDSFFINSTDLSAFNAGNSSFGYFAGGYGVHTVQTGYKFTDKMGTFTTDKITTNISGNEEFEYIDQHGGVVVGISTLVSQSSSSSYPFSAIYGNLSSTNIHTTLSSSSYGYTLYYIIGGVAAAVVIVAVVAYSFLRKKNIPPPEIKQ